MIYRKTLKPIIETNASSSIVVCATSCRWSVLQLVPWISKDVACKALLKPFCFFNWAFLPTRPNGQTSALRAAVLLGNLSDSSFTQIFALINDAAANKLTFKRQRQNCHRLAINTPPNAATPETSGHMLTAHYASPNSLRILTRLYLYSCATLAALNPLWLKWIELNDQSAT